MHTGGIYLHRLVSDLGFPNEAPAPIPKSTVQVLLRDRVIVPIYEQQARTDPWFLSYQPQCWFSGILGRGSAALRVHRRVPEKLAGDVFAAVLLTRLWTRLRVRARFAVQSSVRSSFRHLDEARLRLNTNSRELSTFSSPLLRQFSGSTHV